MWSNLCVFSFISSASFVRQSFLTPDQLKNYQYFFCFCLFSFVFKHRTLYRLFRRMTRSGDEFIFLPNSQFLNTASYIIYFYTGLWGYILNLKIESICDVSSFASFHCCFFLVIFQQISSSCHLFNFSNEVGYYLQSS